MTGDVLKYRFPGGPISELRGSFERMDRDQIDTFDGFIVGSFDLGSIFGFREVDLPSERSDSSFPPVVISKQDYLALAKDHLDLLDNGDLKKVILSRVANGSVLDDSELLFDRLCEAYPNAMVYLISSAHFGTWIGATPERLLEKNGEELKLVALAGTKLANDDSPWRKKEVEEQAYVTDYLLQKLEGLGVREHQLSGPKELIAGPVKHLNTEIVIRDGINWWELVQAIHPTPAVCGIPRDLAMERIRALEPHDRALYCGMIGTVKSGQVKLFVNLRCAQLIGTSIYPYVGGGMTQLSDPEEEWQETENKAQTLLHLL